MDGLPKNNINLVNTQLAVTCLKLKIEPLEQGVNYVKS